MVTINQINIVEKLVEKYRNRVKKIDKESIWQKENQKAIDSYNQRVNKNGLFSDGLRQF